MNILIVSPYFPLPLKTGGHTRLFNIIKTLSSRHVVDLISPITKEEKNYIQDLTAFCRNIVTINIENLYVREKRYFFRINNFLRLFHRIYCFFKGIPLEISGFYYLEMRDKLDNLLKSNHYNIIQVELPRMAQNFKKSFYKENHSLKVLVDYDISFIPYLRRYQCEKNLLYKLIRYIDYRMNRSYALKTWKQFDRLVVMSEIDRSKVLDILPDLSVHVIPNGVDLSSFRPLPREVGDNRLLFLGGTGHFPNIDALLYFLKEIFPKVKNLVRNISLIVIGDGWNKYTDQLPNGSSVEFTGFVEDIRYYLNVSTVLITPIRIGGGTRLKILEAMALGVPIVSTSVGCEGISVVDGQHILLADKPEDFAMKIKEVFSNKQLYSKLTENAYKLVKENFGWDKLALKIEDVYEDAAGKR